MIRMAYMPVYIGDIWDVTPVHVHDRTVGAWKVEQSPQTNVISDDLGRCLPLQLLSSIELEICWKYQFPAKKRQNRLKILMEKPFQPSVTDVYSEIG